MDLTIQSILTFYLQVDRPPLIIVVQAYASEVDRVAVGLCFALNLTGCLSHESAFFNLAAATAAQLHTLACTVMQGLHLTADLHGCRCAPHWLTDAEALGARCLRAVNDAGLQAVAQLFHAFPATQCGPGGVTATVLLAESHLCVHTWPEQRAVTLDVYVCNFGGDHRHKAQALMNELSALFEPTGVETNLLNRGEV